MVTVHPGAYYFSRQLYIDIPIALPYNFELTIQFKIKRM
jgi:hypothetical protein